MDDVLLNASSPLHNNEILKISKFALFHICAKGFRPMSETKTLKLDILTLKSMLVRVAEAMYQDDKKITVNLSDLYCIP